MKTIGILSLLLALLIARQFLPMSIASNTKESWADTDIRTLQTAVEMYRLNAKRLPPVEDGLQALHERPASLAPDVRWVQFIDRMPQDPWGNPYCYIAGDGFSKGFGIYSRGADGQSATQGNDPDDLSSWSDAMPVVESRFKPWMLWFLLPSALTAIIGFQFGRRPRRCRSPSSSTSLEPG